MEFISRALLVCHLVVWTWYCNYNSQFHTQLFLKEHYYTFYQGLRDPSVLNCDLLSGINQRDVMLRVYVD